MVSQSDVLNAMRSASRPVNTTEIAEIVGPQSGRDMSSVVAEVAARCRALSKKGDIERCDGNTWGVVGCVSTDAFIGLAQILSRADQ